MKIILKTTLLAVIWLLSVTATASDFETLVGDLNGRSYSAKKKAIDALQSVDDSRILPTLKAMASGNLYALKLDKSLVITTETEAGFEALSVISQEPLGSINSGAIKRVKINNGVRGKLRTAIASLQLTSIDQSIRLQSARDLIKKPDESLREFIVIAMEKETVNSVRQEMNLALAMIDIHSNDDALRKNSIEALSQSLTPESVSILETLTEKGEDGKYKEKNIKLAEFAAGKLKTEKSKIKTMKFGENLFFGISLGSVLLLAAIGLAITFGVMGVINMAHGEMIMLGAYTTFAIQQLFPSLIELSVILAIPVAFLVSGSVGVIIERLVIRHLYGRPLETLLATFGISLFLQQLVRTYNSNNVPVITPDWMSGFYQVNGALSLTYNRMYIILFSLLVLAALALLLRKTMLGLQMRAVTQNRAMANSMGIRSSWVDALTFGLGSGVAGMAGVALSQITNVGPNMGQGFIIDSFMVVVFGGVGNLLGTFFGAMSLGIFGKFLEPYAGAVLGKIIILVFIILFIQWRPRGLFALKGRFVGD